MDPGFQVAVLLLRLGFLVSKLSKNTREVRQLAVSHVVFDHREIDFIELEKQELPRVHAADPVPWGIVGQKDNQSSAWATEEAVSEPRKGIVSAITDRWLTIRANSALFGLAFSRIGPTILRRRG